MRHISSRPAPPRPGAFAARLAAAAIVSCALAGCQGLRLGGGTPARAPAGGRAPQIAVVDFSRAVRAHPRWPELEALDRRIGDLQARLAVPGAGPAGGPQADLEPELRAAVQQEVAQLRPEFSKAFQQQATGLQDAARKELEAYAAKLRADGQAEFERRRAQLEAQTRKAVEDKQQAFAKDNDQFQQQMFEQYRLQLLNLRLKLEAVQQTNKQEGEKLSTQLEAVTKERDGKIAAYEKANAQALEEFQKQQTQQYAAAVTALQQEISKGGQALLDRKVAEVAARLHTQIGAKQAEISRQLNVRLQADLRARQEAIVANARQQLARSRGQAREAARSREAVELAQLQDAREERARLLATILADLRIEATEMGQQKGYGVIVTQTLAAVDAVDVTDELIARLRH